MTMPLASILEPEIEYPDSDGQPMSDNTLQFRWIVTIEGNLDGQFDADPEVFVAGDLLWYPVKGQPKIRAAPDVLVAFGRPKGYRGSYRQWMEGGVGPRVTWEIQSPGNTPTELDRKFDFYERYGVEEYYLYDPDNNECFGWIRGADGTLQSIPNMDGWVSPALGIRFDLSGEELVLYHPNGERFLTFVELMQRQAEAERQRQEAARQRQEAERQTAEAHRARQRAEEQAEELRQAQARVEREAEQARRQTAEERQAKEQAERRAEELRRAQEQAQQQVKHEQQAREEVQRRAELLAERLRSLGIDPDAQP